MSDILDRVRRALEQPGRPSSDFDLNTHVSLPPDRKLRPAAVLAAITPGRDGYRLILTKRSSALKHHPGQIAFPGGKQDDTDADLLATAMREAEEEIGLPPSQVEVLGTLPSHETVTGFNVTPVLAYVDQPFVEKPEPGEVDEVFQVPLDHVLNLDKYIIEGRRWRGQTRRYYAVPFGPYYIWGATARMLRAWTDQMNA